MDVAFLESFQNRKPFLGKRCQAENSYQTFEAGGYASIFVPADEAPGGAVAKNGFRKFILAKAHALADRPDRLAQFGRSRPVLVFSAVSHVYIITDALNFTKYFLGGWHA